MMQEFVQSITDTINDSLSGVHTAIPGKVVSFDPSTGLATVLPIMKFKKPNGETLDFPQVTGVPVVFQQSMDQKATVAFPVKPDDGCLIIIGEQSLDYWMYGKETDTDLQFDLTNAIAIPGLFTKANETVKAACDEDAVVINVDGKSTLKLKADGLIQADCREFVVNASERFTVNAGRIDLNP